MIVSAPLRTSEPTEDECLCCRCWMLHRWRRAQSCKLKDSARAVLRSTNTLKTKQKNTTLINVTHYSRAAHIHTNKWISVKSGKLHNVLFSVTLCASSLTAELFEGLWEETTHPSVQQTTLNKRTKQTPSLSFQFYLRFIFSRPAEDSSLPVSASKVGLFFLVSSCLKKKNNHCMTLLVSPGDDFVHHCEYC